MPISPILAAVSKALISYNKIASAAELMSPDPSLVQLLDKDRIDIIWCMKLNVDRALKKHDIQGVSSMRYPAGSTIRLGAGFRASPQGRDLQQKIDLAVRKLNLKEMFPLVFQ
mgnify:CR=1 FL=1